MPQYYLPPQETNGEIQVMYPAGGDKLVISLTGRAELHLIDESTHQHSGRNYYTQELEHDLGQYVLNDLGDHVLGQTITITGEQEVVKPHYIQVCIIAYGQCQFSVVLYNQDVEVHRVDYSFDENTYPGCHDLQTGRLAFNDSVLYSIINVSQGIINCPLPEVLFFSMYQHYELDPVEGNDPMYPYGVRWHPDQEIPARLGDKRRLGMYLDAGAHCHTGQIAYQHAAGQDHPEVMTTCMIGMIGLDSRILPKAHDWDTFLKLCDENEEDMAVWFEFATDWNTWGSDSAMDKIITMLKTDPDGDGIKICDHRSLIGFLIDNEWGGAPSDKWKMKQMCLMFKFRTEWELGRSDLWSGIHLVANANSGQFFGFWCDWHVQKMTLFLHNNYPHFDTPGANNHWWTTRMFDKYLYQGADGIEGVSSGWFLSGASPDPIYRQGLPSESPYWMDQDYEGGSITDPGGDFGCVIRVVQNRSVNVCRFNFMALEHAEQDRSVCRQVIEQYAPDYLLPEPDVPDPPIVEGMRFDWATGIDHTKRVAGFYIGFDQHRYAGGALENNLAVQPQQFINVMFEGDANRWAKTCMVMLSSIWHFEQAAPVIDPILAACDGKGYEVNIAVSLDLTATEIEDQLGRFKAVLESDPDSDGKRICDHPSLLLMGTEWEHSSFPDQVSHRERILTYNYKEALYRLKEIVEVDCSAPNAQAKHFAFFYVSAWGFAFENDWESKHFATAYHGNYPHYDQLNPPIDNILDCHTMLEPGWRHGEGCEGCTTGYWAAPPEGTFRQQTPTQSNFWIEDDYLNFVDTLTTARGISIQRGRIVCFATNWPEAAEEKAARANLRSHLAAIGEYNLP